MRISAYDVAGERRLYLERDGAFSDLGVASLDDLLRAEGGAALRRRLESVETTADGGPPAGARLLAPLPHPGKQIFVGVNYTDHVDELPPPWKMTEEPFFFSKLQSAIIGPGDDIQLPTPTASVDYEVELLVVIGERASKVTLENALDHVFGYTIVNDVTERAVQATDNQLTWGKGFDTFCPQGPSVVLTDEIPDPAGLDIWTTVNGEERQRSNTSALIFSIPDLLARITRGITLEPGDVLSTGTPAGCGAYKTPPLFFAPGDVVTVGVDGIGELSNAIVATAS